MGDTESQTIAYKLVFAGSVGVGKTCLIHQITQGHFPNDTLPTIGVDFTFMNFELENQNIKLQIWDTAGQESSSPLPKYCYKSTGALFFVYDISSKSTFDCLEKWLTDNKEETSNGMLQVLIGNKTDMENRDVPTSVGEDLAKKHNMHFFETSAKETEDAKRKFTAIISKLMEQKRTVVNEEPKDDDTSFWAGLQYYLPAVSLFFNPFAFLRD